MGASSSQLGINWIARARIDTIAIGLEAIVSFLGVDAFGMVAGHGQYHLEKHINLKKR